MLSIYVLVEGNTEARFVEEVLAKEPSLNGLALHAPRFGKPGHKGGVPSFNAAKNEITNFLRQQTETVVTMMVDYYALPQSWPGVSEAKGNPQIIEQALAGDIKEEMGSSFKPNRFIPFIQMHEFEAILFSDPAKMARELGRPKLEKSFNNIRKQFNSPEEINDNPQTSPSHRILKLFPKYEKPIHGVLISLEIGLDQIKHSCPHFGEWLAKLEALAPQL
jgi:hypothetical protein